VNDSNESLKIYYKTDNYDITTEHCFLGDEYSVKYYFGDEYALKHLVGLFVIDKPRFNSFFSRKKIISLQNNNDQSSK
jgi:hypothetical protein